jgi:hypothetical protein
MPRDPAEYLQKIAAIVGDDPSDGALNLNLTWSNRAEAMATVSKLRQMRSELQVLRQQLGRDMASVRSEYISRRTAVGKSVSDVVAGALLGRRKIGSANALRRDVLRREQMIALEPYEKAKRTIDSVIRALDEAKATIEASAEYSEQ